MFKATLIAVHSYRHRSSSTDADGLANTNRTNLAIKGIIAIKAMSEISQALGKSQDAETYSVRHLVIGYGLVIPVLIYSSPQPMRTSNNGRLPLAQQVTSSLLTERQPTRHPGPLYTIYLRTNC